MIFMTGGVSFGNVMTNGQKQLSLDQRADANAIFNSSNNLQEQWEQR